MGTRILRVSPPVLALILRQGRAFAVTNGGVPDVVEIIACRYNIADKVFEVWLKSNHWSGDGGVLNPVISELRPFK